MNAKAVRKREIDGMYEIVVTTKKLQRSAQAALEVFTKFVNDPDLPVTVQIMRREQFGEFYEEVGQFVARVEVASQGAIGQLKELERRDKDIKEMERVSGEYNE